MRALVLAAVLGMVGCSAAPEPTPVYVETFAPKPKPAPVVVIHADVAYTAAERTEILAAAEMWGLQTSGVAHVTILWDLAFDGPEYNLEEQVAAGHNLLVRAESWFPWVIAEDAEDGTLLGIVSPAGGIHNVARKPVFMAFVADRMGDNNSVGESLTQVALHEFGHVLGVHHQKTGVMAAHAFKAEHVCLKASDLAAFCEANEGSCDTFPLYPCE